MRPGLVAALLIGVCLGACGGSDEAAPALLAEAILTRSAAAVEELSDFHFRLSHENGATRIPLNLALEMAEGDVVLPDRLKAEVRAKAGSVAVRVEVISIGDETWITNPFTRRWQSLPGVSAGDIADPSALVRGLVLALEEVTLVGQTRIDGVTAYRLDGVVDSGAIGEAFGSAQAGFAVRVELWIGVEDFLPRRARLSGRLSDGEAAEIVRQLDLSDFNRGAEIQPPE